MTSDEVFADPVVVPGPNIRSLFTETESVDADAPSFVAEAEIHRCPRCGRALPLATLLCPDDGAALLDVTTGTGD